MRLPSMLASFSLIYIVRGVNVLIMDKPQGKIPPEFYKTYDSLIGGILPFSAIFLIVVLLVWFYLMRTRFGRNIYAVGGNPRNAFAAGINPVLGAVPGVYDQGCYYRAGRCLPDPDDSLRQSAAGRSLRAPSALRVHHRRSGLWGLGLDGLRGLWRWIPGDDSEHRLLLF